MNPNIILSKEESYCLFYLQANNPLCPPNLRTLRNNSFKEIKQIY